MALNTFMAEGVAVRVPIIKIGVLKKAIQLLFFYNMIVFYMNYKNNKFKLTYNLFPIAITTFFTFVCFFYNPLSYFIGKG